MIELLLGIGFGSLVGFGAKLISEGGVINPKKNLGLDILQSIENKTYAQTRDIQFGDTKIETLGE
jgi:hypothetical protein